MLLNPVIIVIVASHIVIISRCGSILITTDLFSMWSQIGLKHSTVINSFTEHDWHSLFRLVQRVLHGAKQSREFLL